MYLVVSEFIPDKQYDTNIVSFPHTDECPPQPPLEKKNAEEKVSDIETNNTTQTPLPQNFVVNENEPHLIRQSEINDLVRDLSLSKVQAELLGSKLQQWNLLHLTTQISVYQKRDDEFVDFIVEESGFTYCNDVHGHTNKLGYHYSPEKWRLFIDCSKLNLKGVLLHNGNDHSSVPLALHIFLLLTSVIIMVTFS